MARRPAIPPAVTSAILACVLASPSADTVLYVDDDAAADGDGASWATAYRHLQDALAHAKKDGVTSIRVGQGTHRPDEGDDQVPGVRTMTFRLADDLTIAGGFAGVGAEDPDLRDIVAFPTVLSGDLENNDGPEFANTSDNSIHVILAESVSNTVLDGLTICGGNSNLGFPNNEGAAINATGGELTAVDCTFRANLTTGGGVNIIREGISRFARCRFEANSSSFGSAVYARSGTMTVEDSAFHQNSGPAIATTGTATIIDSMFTQNIASQGAAISASTGVDALVIEGCTFDRNEASGQGGAVQFRAAGTLTVRSCDFTDNDAGKGGAVYMTDGTCTLEASTFSGNTADDGAVMFCARGARIDVVGCTVSDNVGNAAFFNDLVSSPVVSSYRDCTFRSNFGGVIYGDETTFEVIDCLFEGNRANRGAAIYENSVTASGTIIRSTFIGNEAAIRGGALILAGPARVVDCDFIGNTAVLEGGAIGSFGPSREVAFFNCRFFANHAEEHAGVVYVASGSEPLFVNCLFGGNTSETGGVSSAIGGHPVFANSTMFANQAVLESGAIVARGGSVTRILSCILWANERNGDVDEGAQAFARPDGELQIDHSCVQGWTGDLGGTGNHGDDPQFVDMDGPDDAPGTIDDDVRLRAESACIDAGNNWSLPADEFDLDGDGVRCELLPIDADGAPRFADVVATPDSGCGLPVVADMGAFEYAGTAATVVVGDIDGDGMTGFEDILQILANWDAEPVACRADLNISGVVDFDDLLRVLGAWGPCPE